VTTSKINRQALIEYMSQDTAVEVVDEPATLDSLDRRIGRLIMDLTQIDTQFSKIPQLKENADFFDRVKHKWQMEDYSKISEKELSIARNRRLKASEMMSQMEEAAMFLRRLKSKDSNFNHIEQMQRLKQLLKEAEIRLKMAEVEEKEAETRKILREAGNEEFKAERYSD